MKFRPDRKLSMIAVLLCTLLIGGCVTSWQRVNEQRRVVTASSYSVKLPLGWTSKGDEHLMLVSRDGPNLQKITLRVSSLDKAFPEIEKAASAGMLPSELSELFVAEVKKRDKSGLPSLEVTGNSPAILAGHDAFRVSVSYRLDNGLEYGLTGLGFIANGHYYQFVYAAPKLVYYDQGLPAFEDMVASFKLK